MLYAVVAVISVLILNQSSDCANVNVTTGNNQQPLNGWLVNTQTPQSTQNFINQTLSRMASGVCHKEVP